MQCGARKRNGQPCQRRPIAGHWRCRLHGGLSTGPRVPQDKALAVANMQAGRRRWLVRLKAAGLKAPCGRKPKGTPKPSKDKRIAQAQRIVERIMIMTAEKNLPAASSRATTVGISDEFAAIGGQSLAQISDLLAARVDVEKLADPEWLAANPKVAILLNKLLATQSTASLAVISVSLKTANQLRDAKERELKRQAILDEMSAHFDAARRDGPA
jgi:hypothetical protein